MNFTKDSFLTKHTYKRVLYCPHTKMTSVPVPHIYAIGWSTSSLGTWHLGLLPTPSVVLPNHGWIGPTATIAALINISPPQLGKLQLALGQMTQACEYIHKPTVAPDQANFCVRCHMTEHCSGRLGSAV